MENFYRPEDAFVIVLNIAKLFGVWPNSVKHPVLRFIYKIYGYGFQLFYIAAVIPPQLINIYLMRKDLQKMMDSFFFTLTCIGFAAKLGVFFSRRKKIESLFQRLHHPIFTPKRKEHFMVLKDYTFIAKASGLVFFFLPEVTCTCWIMIPLVDGKQELLFAAYYPFDTSENPAFSITYAIQAILLLNTGAMNGMIDVLTTNFFVVMMGQLEILKQEFKLLADTSSLPLKDPFCYAEDNFKEILHERIVNCTRHYEAIDAFVKDVKDLFQIGIVTQVCASCIVICVTCFELTLISPNTFQFFVMIQYQICILVEIFFYCWRGNELTVKTSELKDAIYECDWPSIPDKKFRQSICIIMSRLQTPIQIRVGNFFYLSVDTFLSILSSAYSFYVLLKQVQAKKAYAY